MKNKVVIITGGAGFLGQQYVGALKSAGAKVIVWDRVGVNAPTDITSPESVEEKVKEVLEKHGRIDVLINNAAMNPVPGSEESKNQFSPYEQYDLKLWQKELDVGLTGAMICTQKIAPVMMKQKSGSIINIGSHYGLISPDNRIYKRDMFKSIGYATVKGAMLNFTRTWASYLGPYKVRVNCLALGGVFHDHDEEFLKKYSQRTMLSRMAQPGEYNGAILFLASDASSYMTGQTLVIDGGWTAF